MEADDSALPADSTETTLPKEFSQSVDLPQDPTCVLGKNDSLELLRDGSFRFQDGKTLSPDEFAKCKLETGFSFFIPYAEPIRTKHNKRKSVKDLIKPSKDETNAKNLLLDNSSTETTKAVVSVAPTNPLNKNKAGADSLLALALAATVLIVGAIMIASIVEVNATNLSKKGKGRGRFKKLKAVSSVENLVQQKIKQDKEQANCQGNSQRIQIVINDAKEFFELAEKKVSEFSFEKDFSLIEKQKEEISGEIKSLKKKLKELE